MCPPHPWATPVETGGDQPVLQAGAAALKCQASSAGASQVLDREEAQTGEGSSIYRSLGEKDEQLRDIGEGSHWDREFGLDHMTIA